jgi:hypothetical protein
MKKWFNKRFVAALLVSGLSIGAAAGVITTEQAQTASQVGQMVIATTPLPDGEDAPIVEQEK